MTYNQAKKAANKKNAGIVYEGKADNAGNIFRVYFCSWRNRQIWKTVTPEGFEIM